MLLNTPWIGSVAFLRGYVASPRARWSLEAVKTSRSTRQVALPMCLYQNQRKVFSSPKSLFQYCLPFHCCRFKTSKAYVSISNSIGSRISKAVSCIQEIGGMTETAHGLIAWDVLAHSDSLQLRDMGQ
jgi:hypothetical protein